MNTLGVIITCKHAAAKKINLLPFDAGYGI